LISKDYHRKLTEANADGRRIQQLGALAECACAKALELPWLRGINTFKRPDLGHNIEVRLIGDDAFGLRVYPKDHNSRRVVGVIIEKGREREPYRIPGWINAKYAKKIKYQMDPGNRNRPFYGVPQDRLCDPKLLMELIQKEQNVVSH